MSADGVRVAKGYVEIGANLDPLTAKLQVAQNRLLSVGKKIQSAGLGMFTVGAGTLGALVPSILQASDAAEGFNRFQAVMGEQAGVTDAALAEMAQRIGRVKTELRDTASSFQGMFVGLGMNKDEAAKLSTKMTELSLDFASFNNLADSDASERFLAGLSGSGEVFDRFGINIKEAALKAQLARMGITKDATELQKTMARIQIIEDSMQRQGAVRDATTTAGSFANQMKAVSAQVKGASQEIGAVLIPVVQSYLPHVKGVIESTATWLKQNPELVVQLAKLAGGVAVAGAGMVTFGKGVELGISLIQNWRAAVVLAVTGIGALVAKELYEGTFSLDEWNERLAIATGAKLTKLKSRKQAETEKKAAEKAEAERVKELGAEEFRSEFERLSRRAIEEDRQKKVRFEWRETAGGEQSRVNFDRWMSRLASVGSGEAAKGLAARTVEVRKVEEDLLKRIAEAGEETRDAIKNMPPATLG